MASKYKENIVQQMESKDEIPNYLKKNKNYSPQNKTQLSQKWQYKNNYNPIATFKGYKKECS